MSTEIIPEEVPMKGIKLRLYPNQSQIIELKQMFGNHRFVWNKFLNMLEERYQNQKDEQCKYKELKKQNPKLAKPKHLKMPSAYKLNNLLPLLKEEFPFLTDSDSSSLQVTIQTLRLAYDMFFDVTLPHGKPKYKKRSNEESYTGKSRRMKVIGRRYVKLPKLGVIKTSRTGQITDDMIIKRYTVSQDATGRYWLSLQVEVPKRKHLPKTGKVIGIDLGLTDLVICSNGDKFPKLDCSFDESQVKTWQRKFNKRKHQASVQVKLDKHHKVLIPRELTDFKNWQRARQVKATYQQRIKNKRKDYLHKITTQLVKDYDVIVIEKLKSKNMMKNHNLAKSIAHASWYQFKELLQYKCEWYGKQLIVVPPHYTSRTCFNCGNDTGKKPLSVREWTCQYCHVTHDRDINAAQNILAKGLKLINT